MRVSVVVRCHNDESTVQRAIESVLAQAYPPSEYEVIAVDDASTDGSRARLEPFAGRVSLYLEEHRGSIGTAHFGLERSRGEYVAFVDADDTVEPSFLSALADALDAHPGAAFAYCDYEEEHEDGSHLHVVVGDRLLNLLGCNVLFRREIVVREGFWERDLLLPEYALAIRLASRYGVVYVPLALYNYRRSRTSLTRQAGFVERAMTELSERYAAETPDGDIEALRLRDIGRFHIAGSSRPCS